MPKIFEFSDGKKSFSIYKDGESYTAFTSNGDRLLLTEGAAKILMSDPKRGLEVVLHYWMYDDSCWGPD